MDVQCYATRALANSTTTNSLTATIEALTELDAECYSTCGPNHIFPSIGVLGIA